MLTDYIKGPFMVCLRHIATLNFKTHSQDVCLEGPTEPGGASKSKFSAENYTTRQADIRVVRVLNYMHTTIKKRKGFTLLELMLAITIIAIIAAGVIALDIPAQQRNDLDTARNSIIQTLHSARSKARAVDGDVSWGVSIQSSTFVLFKGASYASRDTSYDEATDMPQTLVPSGLSEIVFVKRTGDPTSTGTITLTSKTNEQRTITLNAKGMIDY